MARQASAKRKLYLYAITPGANGRNLGSIGLDQGAVYSITNGRVCAVVSDVPERLRPERRQLAAHQEVLTRLMREAIGVLPLSFGVVVDGPAAMKRILNQNQQALLAQMQRVIGRAEMGLRITWDVPNIFEFFVDTHPELRAMRDRLFGSHRQVTQVDKIDLGRLFDHLLTEERDRHAEVVGEILGPCCVEIKRNKPRAEREIVNLACLIERDGQEQFEAAVFEAAARFDDNYAFDYNGPWAPHNFVDLALDL